MCASGDFPSSFATGVGNNPKPLAEMRGTEVFSRYNVPFRVIPERGQSSDDNIKVLSESGHVLHDDVSGSNFANESLELEPKTRPGTMDTGSFAGCTEILARESTAQQVNPFDLGPVKLLDVFVARDVGPVLA
jgi:hypothetical protein